VVKLFSNEWLSLALARNTGLALLESVPGAKKQLARYAMGLTMRLPSLVKRRSA